jgi:hypothetical protein
MCWVAKPFPGRTVLTIEYVYWPSRGAALSGPVFPTSARVNKESPFVRSCRRSSFASNSAASGYSLCNRSLQFPLCDLRLLAPRPR